MKQAETVNVLRNVAANVRAVRQQLGLTQEDLAERADLAPSFLRRVEAASSNITLDTLVTLAKALEVKLDILLRPAKFEKRAPGRPPRTRKGTRVIGSFK